MIFDKFFKNPEPKPCPYCGGLPYILRVGDNKQFLVAYCSKCGETVVPHSCGVSYHEREAINTWNRWANVRIPERLKMSRNDEK